MSKERTNFKETSNTFSSTSFGVSDRSSSDPSEGCGVGSGEIPNSGIWYSYFSLILGCPVRNEMETHNT